MELGSLTFVELPTTTERAGDTVYLLLSDPTIAGRPLRVELVKDFYGWSGEMYSEGDLVAHTSHHYTPKAAMQGVLKLYLHNVELDTYTTIQRMGEVDYRPKMGSEMFLTSVDDET